MHAYTQINIWGFAGGAPWQNSGGGGNYQCMVYDAEYNCHNSVSTTGFVAGGEYDTFSVGVFSSSAHKQNTPCAICHATTRSSTIMVPGKRSCPDNEWTFEYEGYLMSDHFSRDSRTTFECVDAEPEYVDGESADSQGALFLFNRALCNK
ncbi:uncharacterized protein [Watersipora subatra]|uniref:uncharacterized protein n=1 Tax=Watersipora subatra TaxID=2589382 RepID=UPI00355AFB7F